MQRLKSIDPKNATGQTKTLLNAVKDAFGLIPNVAQLMANSPAVLESYLAIQAAMGKASIGAKLLNQVELTTSEANACSYCTSLLTVVAPSVGLTAADILAGRSAEADDKKTDAALKFARAVLKENGKVSNDELAAVKNAGFDDGEIAEIVTSVVLGCFTNFLNNVARTNLDIPEAENLDVCGSSQSA